MSCIMKAEHSGSTKGLMERYCSSFQSGNIFKQVATV